MSKVVLMHLLCLLFGCSTMVPYYGVNKWEQQPEMYVDQTMSSECMKATENAVALFADHGIFLSPQYRDRGWIEFHLFTTGAISIQQTDSLKAPVIGETSRLEYPVLQYDGERHFKFIKSASIGIMECSDVVIAHELGHALGLEHSIDINNLMFPIETGSLALTDEQADWVRWD